MTDARAPAPAPRRPNAILRRRDYSWVLYPEETLRPFLQRLLDVSTGAGAGFPPLRPEHEIPRARRHE